MPKDHTGIDFQHFDKKLNSILILAAGEPYIGPNKVLNRKLRLDNIDLNKTKEEC